MITNALLISYTTPETPDNRGDATPGATTEFAAHTKVFVDSPTRAQLLSLANKAAGVSGVIYIPLNVMKSVPPAIGGKLAYQLNGFGNQETVEVAAWSPRIGDESHFEVFVKTA